MPWAPAESARDITAASTANRAIAGFLSLAGANGCCLRVVIYRARLVGFLEGCPGDPSPLSLALLRMRAGPGRPRGLEVTPSCVACRTRSRGRVVRGTRCRAQGD